MKSRRFLLTVGLLAASTLLGSTAARACKYCWAAEAAGADYAQQTMPGQGTVNTPPGAFPLDGTINQFQAAPPPAALATAPSADSVVTNADDLRAAKLAAQTAPSPAPAAAPAAPTAPPPAVVQAKGSGHFADAGLVSLAAVGGIFCWRTRRKTGSGR